MDKDAAALVLQARHRQCVEELFDDYAEDFDEHLTSLGLVGYGYGTLRNSPEGRMHWMMLLLMNKNMKMMNLMMTMMKTKVMTMGSIG